MVVLEVQPENKVEEGKHEGQIVGVSERTQPYHYVDIEITPNKYPKMILKASFAAFLNQESKLGKFLERMNINLKVGKQLDLDAALKGVSVSFMTVNKTTPRGTFANIMQETIRPLG